MGLLRLLLNVILAFAVFRLVRGLFTSRPQERVDRKPPRSRLDPKQQVKTTWSEVPDDGATPRD